MMSLGYTERELLDGGLISSSKNNSKHTFDFFVNRAMFPFIDLTGHIVGFGGRTLCDDKRKYINSRDSAVYNKNKFLFSMNIAKNSAVKDGRILLCEGNLDVISLTQAGFENAVASCGTALTAEQAKLISNYAKEVVICYDSDEAGQKATKKAIGILSSAGLKTTVIAMNGAKDPDEYIKKFGPGAFRLLLEKADGAVNYELKKARAATDFESDSGRMEYKDAAVAILAALESPVECDFYGHKVAEELGVSYTVLDEEIKRARKRRFNYERKKQTRDMLRFADRRDSFNPEAAKHPGESAAEEMIICYLYNNPDYYPKISRILSPEKFVTDFNRRIYGFIVDAMGKMEDFSVSSMNESFTPDEIGRITKILGRDRSEGITEEVADDCAKKLLEYKPKENAGELSDDDFLSRMEEMRKKKT
jgi:DNA primase